MSSEPTIRVRELGKLYRLGATPSGYRTLREGLSSAFKRGASRREHEWIWALREVSFDVVPGAVLGIIGRNGAGKTTLLKILSRVTEPTEGYAEIRGRVGSLLEVGTGFHPELTGRENIYLNGAILGMKRREIERKFDEIVSFAEVEQFVDTPIKRYSTGMNLRLAFAVAAHLEPEILLVDEVLAVGDAEFQRKCIGKMSDVAQEGRTVLFVSHDMSAMLRLTEEAILLERGRIELRAPTGEAVDAYLSSGFSQAGLREWSPDEIAVERAAPFRPVRLRLLDGAGEAAGTVSSTQPFSIEFEYELAQDIRGLRIGVYLLTSRGEAVFTSFDTDQASQFEQLTTRAAGHYRSRCQIPADLLNSGRFVLGVNASVFKVRSYFTEEHALSFTVDGTGAPGSQWAERRRGPLRPALSWEVVEAVR